MVKINKILKNKKGFTLIEIIVVLAVIATLAAVLTPMVVSYITDAKLRRAEADTKAIGTAILAFNKDLKEWPIWADASASEEGASGTLYDVLYSSAGDEITSETTPAATGNYTTGGTGRSLLDAQLITNDPMGYAETGVRKWMGPYLEKINEDPWGNKYYVDVYGLQPPQLSPGSQKAVFVISAGPDEKLETAIHQDHKAFVISGDDIVFRIK